MVASYLSLLPFGKHLRNLETNLSRRSQKRQTIKRLSEGYVPIHKNIKITNISSCLPRIYVRRFDIFIFGGVFMNLECVIIFILVVFFSLAVVRLGNFIQLLVLCGFLLDPTSTHKNKNPCETKKA